jgi:hypothetical protein
MVERSPGKLSLFETAMFQTVGESLFEMRTFEIRGVDAIALKTERTSGHHQVAFAVAEIEKALSIGMFAKGAADEFRIHLLRLQGGIMRSLHGFGSKLGGIPGS